MSRRGLCQLFIWGTLFLSPVPNSSQNVTVSLTHLDLYFRKTSVPLEIAAIPSIISGQL